MRQAQGVDVQAALERCGGVATLQQLRKLGVSRRALARARREGVVARPARTRYALAAVDEHLAVAHELTATLSHLSAAQRHGWPVATPPPRPQVTVRRHRNLSAAARSRVEAHWREVPPADARGGVTAPTRTVLDCARDLPFPDALAVADSALRARDVDLGTLRRLAGELKGPGGRRARRVVDHADGRAANPFESVLRALALEAGLDAEAQGELAEPGFWCLADVVDRGRRLVLEADSFEFHATRKGFRKDVRRYTSLVVLGWTVLRFSWEQVMLEPDFVRWALSSWLAARSGSRVPPPPAELRRLA